MKLYSYCQEVYNKFIIIIVFMKVNKITTIYKYEIMKSKQYFFTNAHTQ